MMATMHSLSPVGMAVFLTCISTIGYLVGFWHASRTQQIHQQRQRYELRGCPHRGEATYVPPLKTHIFVNRDADYCPICEAINGGNP